MLDGDILGVITALGLLVLTALVLYWNRSPSANQWHGMDDYPGASGPSQSSQKKPEPNSKETEAHIHYEARYTYTDIGKSALDWVWQHFPNAHHILAWATVILTGIAYVALVVTQDTLESTERAWVGPSDAKIDAVPQIGQDIKTSVIINNTGREPAIDFTSDMRSILVLTDEVSAENTTTLVDDYVTSCLQRHTVTRRQVVYPTAGFGGGGVTANQTIDKGFVDYDIIYGTTIILVQGCFIYKTFNKERHSAFCFFYQAGKTLDPAHLSLCAGGSYAD